MPSSLRVGAYLLWVLALLFPMCGFAQTVEVVHPGVGTVSLQGPWRFHAGDDPRWANPALDDSGWSLLRPDESWSVQGYPQYTGYGWYRLRLEVKGKGAPVSLYLPTVDDNYELFLDGVPVGRFGGFPPHAHLANASPGSIFALPGLREGVPGVLALRVWKSQLASSDTAELGGLEATPVLGSAEVLRLMLGAVVADHDHRFVAREMLSSVLLVTGLVCLVLFARGASSPVLLWIAVYLIADATSALLSTLFCYELSFSAMQLVDALRVTACVIALWFALLHLFGMDRAWRRPTLVLSAVMVVTQTVDTAALLLWQFTTPVLPWIDGVCTVIYTILPAYLFAILYAGIRRNPRINFWPLAISVSAYGLYNIVIDTTLQGQRFTGLHLSQQVDSATVSVFGYPVGARTCLDAVFVLALLLTVARQQAAERARRAVLEMELKSAQEIQRVLVPDTLPEVPGFVVEAMYRPAQEVGGDFFQLLPTAESGLLLVIGDVSGKGLKAAMTVSLIVGAIRTLAEISDSPAALLAGLNRRLVGRTGGGFATCLALHLGPDGAATLANAGHLPPFLGDREVPMEGTMPLGLVDEVRYMEARFDVPHGEQLTFYTDGLLEARRPSGEIFGFERLAALLGTEPSVDTMMAKALDFGQDDDITVLTVSCTGRA